MKRSHGQLFGLFLCWSTAQSQKSAYVADGLRGDRGPGSGVACYRGLDSDQHNVEVCLRCLILQLYREYGCFCKLGVLFVDVLIARALLFRVPYFALAGSMSLLLCIGLGRSAQGVVLSPILSEQIEHNFDFCGRYLGKQIDR